MLLFARWVDLCNLKVVGGTRQRESKGRGMPFSTVDDDGDLEFCSLLYQ